MISYETQTLIFYGMAGVAAVVALFLAWLNFEVTVFSALAGGGEDARALLVRGVPPGFLRFLDWRWHAARRFPRPADDDDIERGPGRGPRAWRPPAPATASRSLSVSSVHQHVDIPESGDFSRDVESGLEAMPTAMDTSGRSRNSVVRSRIVSTHGKEDGV